MSRIHHDHPEPEERQPAWEPPAHLRDWTPPTDEERARVRELIAETALKLHAETAKPPERKPLAYLPARCAECTVGKFVHLGIRYCLSCYLALGRRRA